MSDIVLEAIHLAVSIEHVPIIANLKCCSERSSGLSYASFSGSSERSASGSSHRREIPKYRWIDIRWRSDFTEILGSRDIPLAHGTLASGEIVRVP